MKQQQGSGTSAAQLQQVETDLSRFSKKIDGVLRAHYANRVMRKLIRPIGQNESKDPVLWTPSKFGLIFGAIVYVMALQLFLKLSWLPFSAWLAVVPASTVIWFCESKILPKVFFLGYSFRLMRMEGRFGDEEFPDHYTVAPISKSSTGFGEETWKATPVQPGHLVISIQDSHRRGVGIIYLRTEGRMSVSSWNRDIFKESVLPSLPEEVKALALDFDQACDRYIKLGKAIENSKVLKSRNTESHKLDPETAWQNISIEPTTKHRLTVLAQHFVEGSAAASKGLLLWGPPGTGKTLIAKALADSMECAFFALSLPDIKAGYIGQSGEKVKALWQRALAEPRAVLFVDECEGVFSRRGGVNTDSFSEEIVQAFLAQWDGFTKQNTVWVVGATNRRDLIDPAILSRFGEEVEIGLPGEAQRLAILQGELARRGFNAPLPEETGLLTQGFAGRELETLAGRLAREHTGSTLTPEIISRYTESFRKQGSTQTDAGATWDRLILPDAAMKNLRNTAGMLQHAEAFTKKGISVPRTLLLYGPPGTGKTHIARTLANETGLRFIAASTADMKAGFTGQSGQKVREIFERARESAPSLLFIDEIDIVAPVRGGGAVADSFTQEIVGQLLQEMDGAKAQTQHVFVLAATNRLDQIDSAVLSRFQKRIEIPEPDAEGRKLLLAAFLKSKPVGFSLETDVCQLAERSHGLSGRDLKNWIEHAEQNAVGRAIEAGDPDLTTINLSDFPALQPAHEA